MVKGLVIAGSIIFNKFVEIPSNPQLFLLDDDDDARHKK